ncbi:aldolase/citrate lyase family protein [Saccharopolyspora oryzae]|uniref:aldolase/citrate lyase family protein n=1 Tax=Saccharopolyspora oryzae TaxID=2997343 RepID=UPI0038CD3877
MWTSRSARRSAVAAGADAVILDLEDSVPAADKAEARKTVRETIGRLREQGVRSDIWVRPNSYDSVLFAALPRTGLHPPLARSRRQRGVHTVAGER